MAYTSAQKEMICKMTEQRRFPVARFELHRDGEPEFYQILLDHEIGRASCRERV